MASVPSVSVIAPFAIRVLLVVMPAPLTTPSSVGTRVLAVLPSLLAAALFTAGCLIAASVAPIILGESSTRERNY